MISNKMINNIALTTIKILTALTVLFLVVVIGYICYRGLFARTYREINEIPKRSSNRINVVTNSKEIITYSDILDTLEFNNIELYSRLKIDKDSKDLVKEIFEVKDENIDGFLVSTDTVNGDEILLTRNRLLGEGLLDIVTYNGDEVVETKNYRGDTSYSVVKANSHLSFSYLFSKSKNGGNSGGIGPIILNTLYSLFITLILALPIGILTAVYLCEYAKDNLLTKILVFSIDILSAIPSIIFGLFGMLIFVQYFKWSFSILSGSFTLTIMILPTIIKTTFEALKVVPPSLKEASYALAATKTETIYKVILPYCKVPIISSAILAAGRAIGETAALLYTMGSSLKLATSPLSSARSLAVHIYLTISEGQSLQRAFLAAVVLLFFILILNTSTKLLTRNYYSRRKAWAK